VISIEETAATDGEARRQVVQTPDMAQGHDEADAAQKRRDGKPDRWNGDGAHDVRRATIIIGHLSTRRTTIPAARLMVNVS
jgi:hypothetical protein